MNLRRSSTRNVPGRERGSYLLEALIAILIFSFGVLGLIGLLGSSIR
jgi:Tfp pilus assembly protein PilV